MCNWTAKLRVDSLTSSISVNNDRNKSTFSATRADLDGLYLCEASNKFGRASGSLFIHVADPHRGIYGVFIAIIGVLLVVLIAVVFYALKSKQPQNGEPCSTVTYEVHHRSAPRTSEVEEEQVQELEAEAEHAK
ncbi:nectin-4-like [Arapaima gigas]